MSKNQMVVLAVLLAVVLIGVLSIGILWMVIAKHIESEQSLHHRPVKVVVGKEVPIPMNIRTGEE